MEKVKPFKQMVSEQIDIHIGEKKRGPQFKSHTIYKN